MNYDNRFDLPFGVIINRVKRGKRAARLAWQANPRSFTATDLESGRVEQFIYLVPGSQFVVDREPLLAVLGEGTKVRYNPHIDVKLKNGTTGVWTPTQEDMLANDWFLMPAVEQKPQIKILHLTPADATAVDLNKLCSHLILEPDMGMVRIPSFAGSGDEVLTRNTPVLVRSRQGVGPSINYLIHQGKVSRVYVASELVNQPDLLQRFGVDSLIYKFQAGTRHPDLANFSLHLKDGREIENTALIADSRPADPAPAAMVAIVRDFNASKLVTL